MGDDKKCNCEEKHQDHICMLKCKGRTNKIKDLTLSPNIACLTCGEEADSGDNVCRPVPLFV